MNYYWIQVKTQDGISRWALGGGRSRKAAMSGLLAERQWRASFPGGWMRASLMPGKGSKFRLPKTHARK